MNFDPSGAVLGGFVIELTTSFTLGQGVQAAAEVLAAQIARYDDLPATVEDLDGWCNPVPEDAVDRALEYGDPALAAGLVPALAAEDEEREGLDITEHGETAYHNM